MQFTNRDVEILKFINEFGFCEMTQIRKEFGLTKPRSYQLMQRLIKADLVIHERVFHGHHGVLYLTSRGAEWTNLPPIKNIPKDNYEHQMKIIDVYFKLKERFGDFTWIGERRIKHEEYMKRGIGKQREHLADGLFIMPQFNDEIAIEVELTMKSKKRLNRIMLNYARNSNIKEVWYFCSTDIIDKVKKVAEPFYYIQVFSLEMV